MIYRNGNIDVLARGWNGSYFGYTGLAINNRGDVVGTLEYQPTFFAAGGGQTQIVTPGLDYISVKGLNDAGTALIQGYPGGFAEREGFWNKNSFRTLPVLDPLYPNSPPPNPNDTNSGPWSFSYSSTMTGLNNRNQFAAGVHFYASDPKDPNNPNDDVYTDQFANGITSIERGDPLPPKHAVKNTSPFFELVFGTQKRV